MHSLLVHLLNKEPTVWQMAAMKQNVITFEFKYDFVITKLLVFTIHRAKGARVGVATLGHSLDASQAIVVVIIAVIILCESN